MEDKVIKKIKVGDENVSLSATWDNVEAKPAIAELSSDMIEAVLGYIPANASDVDQSLDILTESIEDKLDKHGTSATIEYLTNINTIVGNSKQTITTTDQNFYSGTETHKSNITIVNNAISLIVDAPTSTNGIKISDKDVSILSMGNNSNSIATKNYVDSRTGVSLDLVDTTYILQLKNNNGEVISSIDLPLESTVVNGNYDADTKKLILTLRNGENIEISIADIVTGLSNATNLENGTGTNSIIQKAEIEGDPAQANIASQWWAAAFGQSNKSLNYSSFTTGTRNTNNGDSAFIAGADNEVKEEGMFGITSGSHNISAARGGLNVGLYNETNKNTSYNLTVGQYLITNYYNKNAIGYYNDISHVNSNNPIIFEIGNGGIKQIEHIVEKEVLFSGGSTIYLAEPVSSTSFEMIATFTGGTSAIFRLSEDGSNYWGLFTYDISTKSISPNTGVSVLDLGNGKIKFVFDLVNCALYGNPQTINFIYFRGSSSAVGSIHIKQKEIVEETIRSNAFEVYEDGHAEVFTTGSTLNSIPTKAYVDTKIAETEGKLDKHTEQTQYYQVYVKGPEGSQYMNNMSSYVLGNALIVRDAQGRAMVQTPESEYQIANKGYVDTKKILHELIYDGNIIKDEDGDVLTFEDIKALLDSPHDYVYINDLTNHCILNYGAYEEDAIWFNSRYKISGENHLIRLIINSNNEINYDDDTVATLDTFGKLSTTNLPAFKTINNESVIGSGNINTAAKVVDVGINSFVDLDNKNFPLISLENANTIYNTFTSGTPVIVKWKFGNVLPVEFLVFSTDNADGSTFDIIVHNEYLCEYKVKDGAVTTKVIKLGKTRIYQHNVTATFTWGASNTKVRAQFEIHCGANTALDADAIRQYLIPSENDSTDYDYAARYVFKPITGLCLTSGDIKPMGIKTHASKTSIYVIYQWQNETHPSESEPCQVNIETDRIIGL